MKILGRESLTAAVVTAAFLPSNAQNSAGVTLENECIPVHETLKELGAEEFSKMLITRGIDFKYGQFTIFAPSDKLLNNQGLILKDAGHTNTTVNDILLFHVSAEKITENITDSGRCGKSLLMLNEELHVNQENSITNCRGGKKYQIGLGNVDLNTMPEIVGNPIQSCDSVIYTIEGALMLPSLPNVTLPPTIAPKITKPPTRQGLPATAAPTIAVVAPTEETTSASNTLLSSSESLTFAAFAALILSFF